jgi:membrane associated rhomboid family serine protease
LADARPGTGRATLLLAMIRVLRSPSRRVFDEAVLVLKALEIPFERGTDGGLYELYVGPDDAPRASRELVEYLQEDPLVPERLVGAVRRGRPWPGALLYAVIVIVVFYMEARQLFGFDWWTAGLIDASLVRSGEWWRAITALTLHSGIDHIASNLVFGAFFGALLAEATGNGLAWAMFVLSGFAGNLANVLVRSGDHRAVGASTAIFGALGALAAHEWARGWTDARDMARRWAPLVGGVILLGYLGAGGDNTDVIAHLTGFGAGAVLGVIAARTGALRRAGPRLQAVLAVAALVIVVVGWACALSG